MTSTIELFTPEKQAGFRLQSLEVLNWGTFHKLRWQIQPNGQNALLTGDIGSGKSTLVDALTCLLVPHHKITFNKAAGAEGKERNIPSYVKGEYKKEKEEVTKAAKAVYLRPDNSTYTVIIGNFFNEGYAEHICLAQVFWIGSEGKVEKLLVIADRLLSITSDFSGATDITDLRKRLRKSEGVQLFNDNFSQYSEHFRRLFGMNSEKAIDLFYQTVSMKSVSSLTDFVREQMLERTDVKEQIAALLRRFEDLKKAHEAVVNAREQHHILKPLTEACKAYDDVSREIESIEAMMNIAPAWFAMKRQKLLKEAIENTQKELGKTEKDQERLASEKTDLESRLMAILIDIENNGGKRIEQIAEEIKRQEYDRKEKKESYDQYEQLAKNCGFKSVNNEQDFYNNIGKANQLNNDCEQNENELRERRDTIVSELRKHNTEYNTEEKELQSLKERKTQIPGWLIGFRTQLCIDLRIAEDELPFAGELLKVNEQEISWEGAIEKLFQNLGISLLVPALHYRSVSKYVNDNQLKGPDGKGIKLTYLEADLHNLERSTRQMEDDSIVFKVDIKPDTPFYDWLEAYLQRIFGSYLCVDVQGLQQVPFGITRQGLIKSGKIRHTKDDRRSIDDRKNYVLGWSNIEKIKALESSLSKLCEQIFRLTSQRDGIEQEQKKAGELKQQIGHLLFLNDYSKINWQYHAEKIHLLEKEQNELLNNNDKLALLQQKKKEVESLISAATDSERAILEKVGSLKRDIRDYREKQIAIDSLLEQASQNQRDKWFPFIDEKMNGISISLRNADARQEEFRKQFQGDNGELKRLRFKHTSLRSAIEKSMREIKEHSRAEYSEIADNIEARAEYMQKFERLVSEDLKRHEKRFKEELNSNTINSIAVFDSQLQKHEKDIKQKIKIINQHLHEIVYNAAQDTYITIAMDATASADVRLFKEDLKNCYIGSFNNNEQYSEAKYEQVKRILDRFSSGDNSDKDWSSTVTDVRQWFEFNASERYRADNSEKEFYEGSSGKSGGQKEKLAYTILASALAYQFGLQFGETESRSFRFVAIDEAFGRGSDESTRYGLELFRKLNLQLLIVTPLQKIHVIETHVNSFHFISNRDGNNSQVSNFTKEEYIAEKGKRNNIFQTVTQTLASS